MLFGKPHQNYILDEIINANLKYSLFLHVLQNQMTILISRHICHFKQFKEEYFHAILLLIAFNISKKTLHTLNAVLNDLFI